VTEPRGRGADASRRRGGWQHTAPLVCAAHCFALSLSAAAKPVPHPEFDRTAACVAAMKNKAGVLSDRYRAGDDSVKPELMSLTEAGFAFIGTAYEAGLRKDDADRRLGEAEERQKSMPEPELAKLTEACRREGTALLDKSNAFERALVKNAARMRVKRLRDKHTGS
jgi:hypothetical protein